MAKRALLMFVLQAVIIAVSTVAFCLLAKIRTREEVLQTLMMIALGSVMMQLQVIQAKIEKNS